MIPRPWLLDGAIENMERSIEGAKNGHKIDEYMCDFMGQVLFGMQLYATTQMKVDFEKGVDVFIKEIEEKIPIFKYQLKRAAEMTGAENE